MEGFVEFNHMSDCAVHNEPALPAGECDCTPYAMLQEECGFWWVWTKGGHPPRWFHQTQEAAETEAQRLAVKHRPRKFIVLHAYTKFSAQRPSGDT